MHKQKIKKGIILIYVLFLVTLSIVFSTILLNNNAFLFNISEVFDSNSVLYSNINKDGKILIGINREYNLNGSGFNDNISCPTTPGGVTMSGTINKQSISTYLVNSGSVYCEGNYLGKSVKLYFNTGFTDFVSANYSGTTVSLVGGIGVTGFGDLYNTRIDFSTDIYKISDNVDDNFNSDNYMVTSTGNTATGVYYSGSLQDDDVLGRKVLYGYVDSDIGFKKVFWNTYKTLKIIDENTNNNDNLNIKIGQVSSGILNLNIDKDAKIKLVQFTEESYFETNELIPVLTLNGDLLAGTGYLQENGGELSLSSTKTGNEFIFDFSNNDYAIFLKNTGSDALLYKISGETTSGTGVYITPIDDSDNNIVRYMGNDILIDKNGRYISKETELLFEKYGNNNITGELFSVAFDGNGGTGYSPTNMVIANNTPIGTLPTTPTKSGYIFTGWSATTGGTQIGTGTLITGDETFYAQWRLPDWREQDSKCLLPDITIGTQVWAGCNSTLGTGVERGKRDIGSNGYVYGCYNYNGSNDTSYCTIGLASMASDTSARVFFNERQLDGINNNGDSEVDNIWGKLYKWSNASGACPSGRRLPTSADWETLEIRLNGLVDCRTSDSRQCSGLGWLYNNSKTTSNNIIQALKIPLAGYRDNDGISFENRGYSAVLWSNTTSYSDASYRELQRNYSTVYREFASQSYGFSVRCLKN